MSDLKEYIELFEKLKGGEDVVPQSREEAFRLAFLYALSGGDIMDQLELYATLSNMELPSLLYISYDGSAVVLNHEIHIMGSSNQTGYRTKHCKYDGSSWVEVSTLPYAFPSGSAVVYNNEIHILGGSSNNTAHYKWNGSRWTSMSTLPYAFASGSAVVFNNEIHILGGNENGHAHYKWDGTSWSEVSTLPYGFNNNNSAVIHRDEIHILGSTNWSDGLRSHYKYDGSSWVEVSTLPVDFSNGSAVVYDDEIHIMAPRSSGKAHYKLFNEPLKLYTIKETA